MILPNLHSLLLFSPLGRAKSISRTNSLIKNISGNEKQQFTYEVSNKNPDELGRLDRAGFLSESDKKGFYKCSIQIGVTTIALVWLFFVALLDINFGLTITFCSAYCYLLGVYFYLEYLGNKRERDTLYYLPLNLELLCLLVQSGNALLPSLAKVIESANEDKTAKVDPVTEAFQKIYHLSSSGHTFSESLHSVAATTPYQALAQTMLHLDIAGNEGGELVNSLRNLTSHAGLQWKLSVEARVRKLENAVVFPVFFAVLGLLMLTAAVPLVPLVEFTEQMNNRPEVEQVVIK